MREERTYFPPLGFRGGFSNCKLSPVKTTIFFPLKIIPRKQNKKLIFSEKNALRS